MLKWIILLVGVFFSVLIACGGSADTGRDLESGEVEELPLAVGESLFKLHCVMCHGVDGKLGLNNAGDLTKSELSLLERKGVISEGRGTMISYRRILSRAEIDAVARYTVELTAKTDE
nr:cytochrome c [Saprospiraceae bacterium]